ncbi:hypothetical protein MBLNU459_g6219t1 [Dothideomycetes sp. NU459]
MNALNILSGLSATPPPSPPRSRTSSSGDIHDVRRSSRDVRSDLNISTTADQLDRSEPEETPTPTNEKTPLLQRESPAFSHDSKASGIWRLPSVLTDAVVTSVRLVLAVILAPAQYLLACFYDEQGSFSILRPVRSMTRFLMWRQRPAAHPVNAKDGESQEEDHAEKPKIKPKGDSGDDMKREDSKNRASPMGSFATATAASDSETDRSSSVGADDSPARNTRSKTAALQAKDEIAPAKKSIRIKLHNEEALKRQRRQRAQEKAANSTESGPEDKVAAVANSLKSPSSPVATKLKYPRAPAPPRPLVPRRQASYTMAHSTEAPKKTLIIDLDETLIHSMAKGGRMSTGHMVEVKIQGPIGSNGLYGPQIPILYYVHERPYCHEFLRKVCKWYNLIVFTASVQEYADPVIDWLERERKYFSGRYYRQHCTFRNGAYIKDLSQVEPDLSKVMILDNSPMSYIFHEDNAIPIEGWISDPTDSDLLHLVPLLEGLHDQTNMIDLILLLRLTATVLITAGTIFTLRLLAILPSRRPPPAPRRRGTPTHLLIVLGSGGHTAEMLAMLRHAVLGRGDRDTTHNHQLEGSASDAKKEHGNAGKGTLDWSNYTHRTWVVSSGDSFSAARAREFEAEIAAHTAAAASKTTTATAATATTVVSDTADAAAAAAPPAEPSYSIIAVPRARRIHQPLYTAPWSSLACLHACLRLLLRHPSAPAAGLPDLVLTNGPATATILVAATLVLRFLDVRGAHGAGKMRTVYVESWARVRKLSLSGRLLCWVVDRVLVQWAQLEGVAGRGEFLGVLV